MQSTFSVSIDLLSFNCRKYHYNVPYAPIILLIFNFSKLNTSKATLLTWLNKFFLVRTTYILVFQGAKSIILNNSYRIYIVKCPWF